MFLSQKPYLPKCSLRELIIYPKLLINFYDNNNNNNNNNFNFLENEKKKEIKKQDKLIIQILKKIKLNYLINRNKLGLNFVENCIRIFFK